MENIPQGETADTADNPRPSKQCPNTRVLSVQSHVVSGYCGNKSATFPLQLLQFEVDSINTVQLSNHTQYKVAKGQLFTNEDLNRVHEGLRDNQLLQLYDFILSGYMADANYINNLANLIKETKQKRNEKSLNCYYTFDPVLGDDGVGYYVPNGFSVSQAYKDHLLPLADIITPNRFEASILSGINIDPLSVEVLKQAREAINVFHGQMNISIVVLTSLELASEPSTLLCIVSHDPKCGRIGAKVCCSKRDDTQAAYCIRVPKLSLPFTGTGDLFTALFTGWLSKTGFDIKISLENTVNTIHDILEDTLSWHQQSDDKSVQSYELRLVQNQDKIVKPSNRFVAKPL